MLKRPRTCRPSHWFSELNDGGVPGQRYPHRHQFPASSCFLGAPPSQAEIARLLTAIFDQCQNVAKSTPNWGAEIDRRIGRTAFEEGRPKQKRERLWWQALPPPALPFGIEGRHHRSVDRNPHPHQRGMQQVAYWR